MCFTLRRGLHSFKLTISQQVTSPDMHHCFSDVVAIDSVFNAVVERTHVPVILFLLHYEKLSQAQGFVAFLSLALFWIFV